MISAGQAFVDAVSQSSRRFRMRLFYGSNEIDGIIRNAKIHLGSSGPDSFSVGAVYSAFAEIVLDGRNTSLEGKELRLDVGVMTDAEDNTYSDITLGYFTVLRPAATKYRTTFTAVGRITSKLAVTEFTAPTTLTLANIASAITQLTGVTITFAAGIDTFGLIEYPITGNCRDALTALAIAVGGYATETNAGGILVNRYNSSTSTASYGPDTMQALPEIGDYDFEITGVQAVTPTGLYEEGDPINVSIESNYVTEDLFEGFAGDLIGFSYRPGSVALALGDPRIEPKDVLEISTPDEEIYIMPCLAITHIFDGGFQTEITTPAVQTVGEVVGTMGVAVKEAAQKAERASEAANDARKVAINYLARDNTGIMVADMSDGQVYTPSTVPSGVKNTFIDEDSFDVRDGQETLASFGPICRIGNAKNFHIQIDNTGLLLKSLFDDTICKIGLVETEAIETYEEWTWPWWGGYVPEPNIAHYHFPHNLTEGCTITAVYKPPGSAPITISAPSDEPYHETVPGVGEIIYNGHGYIEIYGMEAGTRITVTYTVDAIKSCGIILGSLWGSSTIGDKSVSIGVNNDVRHESALAVGKAVKTACDMQVVFGHANTSEDNHAFEIGNGVSHTLSDAPSDALSNAFAVSWDGDIEMALDENAAASTVDGRLYQALVNAGWESEVIL